MPLNRCGACEAHAREGVCRYGGGPEILRHWHQAQYSSKEGEDPRPELLVYPLKLNVVKAPRQPQPSASITVSRDVRHPPPTTIEGLAVTCSARSCRILGILCCIECRGLKKISVVHNARLHAVAQLRSYARRSGCFCAD